MTHRWSNSYFLRNKKIERQLPLLKILDTEKEMTVSTSQTLIQNLGNTSTGPVLCINAFGTENYLKCSSGAYTGLAKDTPS